MKVERLHLIIHPGFIAESEDQLLQKGQSIMGAAEAMRAHYSDRLQKMLPDEVALCMLHVHPSDVTKMQKKSLFRVLMDEFKERLGNRLLITDQSASVTNTRWISNQFASAMQRAISQGTIITSNTPTIAYGETLFCCVSNCAERVNASGKFDTKTIIDARHCDVDIPGGVDSNLVVHELPYIQRKFPHTLFSMESK